MQDDLITPPILILDSVDFGAAAPASSYGYTIPACFADYVRDYQDNQGVCPECGKVRCVIFSNAAKHLNQGRDERKLLALSGPNFPRIAKDNYDSFDQFSKLILKNYEINGNQITRGLISKVYRDDLAINRQLIDPTPNRASRQPPPQDINVTNKLEHDLRMCLHALNADNSSKGLKSNPDIATHCKNKRYDLAALAFSKQMDLSERDLKIFNTFYAAQSRIGQVSPDAQELKASLQYIATAGDITSRELGKHFNGISKILRSNIKNANAIPFDQAMKTLGKMQNYPQMKIAPHEIDAIKKAVRSIDYKDIGDRMQKMSKGFGYAGKALQIDSIHDKILSGIDTGDWKPLLLEFESMAASAAAAYALSFAYSLAAGAFALSGAGTIALIAAYVAAATYFTPERMDNINNVVFK